MNSLSLKLVGVVIGVVWIAAHVLAMVYPEPVRAWVKGFPRSRAAGLTLLVIDFLWTYVLIYRMDWGEFYYLQTPVMVGLPVFLYLVIRYVDDFLAARALGILGLLAAAPGVGGGVSASADEPVAGGGAGVRLGGDGHALRGHPAPVCATRSVGSTVRPNGGGWRRWRGLSMARRCCCARWCGTRVHAPRGSASSAALCEVGRGGCPQCSR